MARDLGIEVEDATEIAEKFDIRSSDAITLTTDADGGAFRAADRISPDISLWDLATLCGAANVAPLESAHGPPRRRAAAQRNGRYLVYRVGLISSSDEWPRFEAMRASAEHRSTLRFS